MTDGGRMRDGGELRSAAAVLAFTRRVSRAERRHRLRHGRALKAVVMSPLRSAIDAARAVRAFGRATTDDAGVSWPRQFAYMWWLSLRHGYDSETVYRFRLFTRDRVRPLPRFIHWEHAALLYRVVAQRTGRDAALTIADKRRFFEWCSEQGIPTPPILVEFAGGLTRHRALAPGAEPRCDLFAKWGTQYGGDDTARWLYRDGRYLDQNDRAWSFDELTADLAERSREGALLLQPLLVNHPSLRQLSPSALSTVRVMTIRAPGRPSTVFACVLRMGTGRAIVDNVTQGGLVSAIDVESGIAGVGRRYDAVHRTHLFPFHPDTAAAIRGFRMPHWQEVVKLAREAHDRLGEIACVGWDVAILEDGPVLVEGNWNPGTKFVQVATQTPLLATEFGEVFAAWLAHPACAVDDRWLAEHKNWSPV